MKDPLYGLNDRQKEAVLYFDSPLLIIAGAGSGKTRVITHKIAYILHKGLFPPQNILAVTFTNKAAREMRERVGKLVGVSPNFMQISTFHSLCLKILRREIERIGWKSDFDVVDRDEQKKIVKRLMKDLNISVSKISPDAVLRGIGKIKLKFKSSKAYLKSLPQFLSEIEEYLLVLFPAYEKSIKNLNGLDFDDLLNKTNEIFYKFPDVAKKYSERFRYILVDEFQDTNPPQYELIKFLTTTHKNVCVVGDEDQSIYGFRGAIIENILNFESDFPGTKLIKLEQNYRSTKNILKVAGSVIKNNTLRRGKVLWTDVDGGEKVKLIVGRDSDREVEYVINEIVDLQKKYPDETIGILYRMNFISRRYEGKLRMMGLKYKVYGSMSFFKRKEVKDMVSYLKVVLNPNNDISLLRIINTPPRKIGEKTVEKLRNGAEFYKCSIYEFLRKNVEKEINHLKISTPLLNFFNMIEGFRKLYKQISLKELCKTIFLESCYKEYLERDLYDGAEERIGNVEEFSLMLDEEEGKGKTLPEIIDEISLLTSGDESSENVKILLMTIHTAKGLEFDNVFLVSMEDGVLPHIKSIDLEDENGIEEERRLCYVGMTRAKKRLYLSYANRKYNYESDSYYFARKSRFLEEIPKEYIEEIGDFTFKEKERKFNFDDKVNSIEALEKFFSGNTKKNNVNIFSPEKPNNSSVEYKKEKNIADIMAGDRVMHPKFGKGIVWRIQELPSGKKITVLFEEHGKKILMEKFANLKKV